MNEYIYERREGKREEKSVYRDAEVNMISLICMWGGTLGSEFSVT